MKVSLMKLGPWSHNVEGADSGRLNKPVTAEKFKDKVAYSCMWRLLCCCERSDQFLFTNG